MRSPFFFAGIYAILEPHRRDPLAYARALLAGGVRVVQVRAKSGVDRDLLRVLVPIVRGYNGIVIVNDDVDAALEADGLHLGQEDAARYDLRELRARLGDRILGLSCGTPVEAQRVDPRIVDYLGVGPIFTTHSKTDAGGAIGVNGVRAVATATHVPCVAIGGIDAANLVRVKESSVQMAAIISALADAHDPQALARELTQIWSGS
jgi:thiamine-phosphate pyrophosphorylase